MDKKTKTILLVEDEIIIAMNGKIALEKYGYNVINVNTGEKAIEEIKKNNYIDLILMDIDLGAGIDGPRTATTILIDRDIPIIFLSNHIEPEIVEKTEMIFSYGYVVKNTGITVLDASIKMALKLFAVKKELKNSEKILLRREKNLLGSQRLAHLGSWSLDVSTNRVEWTEELYRMYGFDPTLPPPQYTEHMKLFTPQSWENLSTSIEKTKSTGIPYDLELETIRKDGGNGWMWVHGEAIIDAEGNTISLWGAAQDITERKQVEEALRTSKKKFKAFFSNAQVALFRTGISDGKLIEINQRYAQVAGYSNIDDCLAEFNSADAWVDHSARIELQRILKEKKYVTDFETEIIRRDGTHIWILFSATIFPESGTIEGSLIDITERKQAEQEIKRQLSEKETLLKEVHHRIKNNMSSIEGLLSMQADSTDNADVKTALYEAISRVQSIRVLYEKLLISKEYQDVSVKYYTESLIDSLVAVFPENKNTAIEKKITDFTLTSKIIIPVGIIINELLTNIFKYAFKGRDGGNVLIYLDKTETHVTLTIQDNGIGIDERIDLNKSPGFGLTIVKMLAEQLKGTFTSENDKGTRSVLKFDI